MTTTIEVSIVRQTKSTIHVVLIRPEGFRIPRSAANGLMLAEIARSLGQRPAEVRWSPVESTREVEPTSISLRFEPTPPSIIRTHADGSMSIPISALGRQTNPR